MGDGGFGCWFRPSASGGVVGRPPGTGKERWRRIRNRPFTVGRFWQALMRGDPARAHGIFFPRPEVRPGGGSCFLAKPNPAAGLCLDGMNSLSKTSISAVAVAARRGELTGEVVAAPDFAWFDAQLAARPQPTAVRFPPPPSGTPEARTYAATHAYAEMFDKDHGRREWRRIWVGPTGPFAANFAGAAQLLRIERHLWKGAAVEPSIEGVFGLTNRAASAATPDQLLAAARKHWGAIENGHHHRRDRTYREDQSPVRDPNETPCYAALRAGRFSSADRPSAPSAGPRTFICPTSSAGWAFSARRRSSGSPAVISHRETSPSLPSPPYSPSAPRAGAATACGQRRRRPRDGLAHPPAPLDRSRSTAERYVPARRQLLPQTGHTAHPTTLTLPCGESARAGIG